MQRFARFQKRKYNPLNVKFTLCQILVAQLIFFVSWHPIFRNVNCWL